MISEQDIIEGCKQNESVTQQLLYEKFVRVMYGVCLRYIEQSDELEDIVQEGFIKVFTSINKFRNEGSFEGWMKRIFINASINYLKKNKKQWKKLDIDDSKVFQQVGIIEEPNHDSFNRKIDIKDIDANKIDYDLINDADFSHEELLSTLKNIPESFRVVFNLACIEGLKHEEIARMLNIDTSTSRTRLIRARAMLQKALYEKSIERLCKQ